jgi:hypothetical protein
MKTLRLLSLLLLIFIAPASAQPPMIVECVFGIVIDHKNTSQDTFIPTSQVPLVEKQGYGWAMVLNTDKQVVKWREEFTLPSAPEIWGADDVKLSEDRRTSTVERETPVIGGTIQNFWAVAPGDPEGEYRISVVLENGEAVMFTFNVSAKYTVETIKPDNNGCSLGSV